MCKEEKKVYYTFFMVSWWLVFEFKQVCKTNTNHILMTLLRSCSFAWFVKISSIRDFSKPKVDSFLVLTHDLENEMNERGSKVQGVSKKKFDP